MSARSASCAGFTLVELMVSLAILGISLGVVTGALASIAVGPPDPSSWSVRLEEARTLAINLGEPVVVWPDSAHLEPPVSFLPDGRVVGIAEPEETR